MTEHAAVVFVFFFLAEYASIVLICILTTILFLGGHLIDLSVLLYICNSITNLFQLTLLVIVYLSLSLAIVFELLCDSLIITFNLLPFSANFILNENTVSIYETEFFKFFNSIKTEFFIHINPLNYTQSDVLFDISNVLMNFFNFYSINIQENSNIESTNTILVNFESGIISSIILGIKSSILVFVFI